MAGNKMDTEKKNGAVGYLLGSGWKKTAVSLAVCCCALFAVIALNFFIRVLPSSMLQKDMTTTGIYSLSADTKELLESLNEDVNIYWICAAGKENSRTETILQRYAEAGERITVTMIDPAYSPNFVSLHTGDASLTYNSIIVESARRSQTVKYADYNTSTYFLLEDYMNSALSAVTAEKQPVVYMLEGHGETVLSADLVSQIALNGYTTESYSFLTASEMPDDAAVLLIINPQRDITAEESSAVVSYLENGGSLLLVTGFSAVALPNLDFIMENYGLQRVPGYIFEDVKGSYYSSPSYIVPSVQSAPATASITEGVAYVLAPVAHGITTLDSVRSSLQQHSLLRSSDYSYAKQDLMTLDTSFAVGDIEGPFDVGTLVTENVNGKEAKVIWYSSSAMLDSNVDAVVSGTNTMLFLNSVNYLAGSDVATLHAKATATGTLTVMPQTKAVWSAIMLGIMPGCMLALGAVVCARRRRR